MSPVVRAFSRQPAAPIMAVGSLALAIALATAMFAVVESVAWRPIPVPAAGRLVELTLRDAQGRDRRIQSPLREDLLSEGLPFADVEGYGFGSAVLGGADEPRVIATAAVTPGLTARLGMPIIAGRAFRPDDVDAVVPAALVKESLWRSRFGSVAELATLGLWLDGVRHEVVGVVPDSARFPEAQTEVWKTAPRRFGGQVLAVVRRDFDMTTVDERLSVLSATWRASGRLDAGTALVGRRPVQERLTDRLRPPLFAMLGATVLVWLGAVTNVVTLLLIRAIERETEFATRVALGLSRAQLFLSQVLEGATLGLVGTSLGLLLTLGTLAAAARLQPPEMNFVTGARAAFNLPLIVFFVAVGLVSTSAMAFVPAGRVRRQGIEVLVRQSAGDGSARQGAWTSVPVALQVAVTLLVLVTASVLATSFLRQTTAQRGFDPAGLTTVEVSFQAERYREPRVALALLRAVDGEVERAFPGVTATVAVGLPPGGAIIMADGALQVEGGAALPDAPPQIPYVEVDSDFFATLGISLLEGRTFRSGPSDELIVNELMARRYWPGRSAVGQRVRFDSHQPWRTIVGVAKDVRQVTAADDVGRGIEVYLPFAADQGLGSATLALRGLGSETAAALVKTRLRAADPNLPLSVESMEQRLFADLWSERFFVRIGVVFAIAAVVVAALGIYVVAAYRVRQRRHELAVRIAVGAAPARLAALVVRRALIPVAFGSCLGAMAVAWTQPLLASLLFETTSGDATVLGSAIAVLVLVVGVGTLRPALEATRTDPNALLRSR